MHTGAYICVDVSGVLSSDRAVDYLYSLSRATLRKDTRINIRISSRDHERIQMRAAREGVPYQTYISSTLHKLVTGRLKETG